MDWGRRLYNEQQINEAGEILKKIDSSEEEVDSASKVLDNWRAIHNYPMHVFQIRLKEKANLIDKNPSVVQRLKRTPAIIFKLRRKFAGKKPSVLLHEMQDIGGCRAVLSNAKLINKLPPLLKGEIKHKLIKTNDYITYPKREDGYRSLHLIYSFKSDKGGKKEYNGLLTEIQIRSKLQHIWATAVEMVGSITMRVVKAHEGDPRIIEFFRLVSSAFAKMEGCPLVSNTPEDEKTLYLKIKELETEIGIIRLLANVQDIKEVLDFEMKDKKNVKFFLIELDLVGHTLKIKPYTEREEEKAIIEYSELEKKRKEDKSFDVVLIGADALKDLKKAYPNYFLDIEAFLKLLKEIITKY